MEKGYRQKMVFLGSIITTKKRTLLLFYLFYYRRCFVPTNWRMVKIVVLVVDSSVLIIERWQIILAENENIESVYGAVSYKDASKLFKEISPDVVLLDGSLPGTMSIDLLTEMKAAGEKTPVIILNNSDDEYLKEKCNSLGACLFFDKYNDFEKIPAEIDHIVKKKPGQQMNSIPGKVYELSN